MFSRMNLTIGFAMLLIGVAMQFFGFLIIEPAWLGNIIGWASLFFYFYTAIIVLSVVGARAALGIFLAGVLICLAGYFTGPSLKPSIKAFLDAHGINLATGYEPRSHRRGR